MLNRILQNKYTKYLAGAGITLNGSGSRDLQVHDQRLYKRVFLQGMLGFGEAYMDGWWDVEVLDEFFTAVLVNEDNIGKPTTGLPFIASLRAALINLQKPSRAFHVGKKHYDVGNALFVAMLDSYMNYSCGYWKDADRLEIAQQAKMKLSCEKLMLEPGMTVLDIGCGWGSLAKYAAENYDVSVTGITISSKQAGYARQLCKDLPIEIKLMDYRELNGKFDRVYSIGMFEHVGYKNYKTYMQTARKLMHEDSLFLLHTIGSDRTVRTTDPWIEKYIFPNSMLPSAAQITSACDGLLMIEDWHNFGAYYDQTLMAWFENIETHWPELKADYDERFHRMWKYYLLVCAASFRARKSHLWQIVLSPPGIRDCYQTSR